MRTGRPKAPIVLTKDEARRLAAWSRLDDHATDAVGLRARIILRAAAGDAGTEIAALLGITTATVCKWRGRFVTGGLEGIWPNHAQPDIPERKWGRRRQSRKRDD